LDLTDVRIPQRDRQSMRIMAPSRLSVAHEVEEEPTTTFVPQTEEAVEVLDDDQSRLPATPPSPQVPRTPSPSPSKGVEVSPIRYGLAVARAAETVVRNQPPAIVLSNGDRGEDQPWSSDEDDEPLGSLPSFLKRNSFASSSGDESNSGFSLRPASRNSIDSHSSGRARPNSVESLTSLGFRAMLNSSGQTWNAEDMTLSDSTGSLTGADLSPLQVRRNALRPLVLLGELDANSNRRDSTDETKLKEKNRASEDDLEGPASILTAERASSVATPTLTTTFSFRSSSSYSSGEDSGPIVPFGRHRRHPSRESTLSHRPVSMR